MATITSSTTSEFSSVAPRVLTCAPLLFSIGSFFMLLGEAWLAKGSAFSVFAVCLATWYSAQIAKGAARDARAGRPYKIPYGWQAKANLSLGLLTGLNLGWEKGAQIVQTVQQPFLQAVTELWADKPLVQSAALTFGFLLWASGSRREVDRKNREEMGLAKQKKINTPATRWAIGDVGANILTFAAWIGAFGLALALSRDEDKQDKMDVDGLHDFASKHVTPMRTIGVSYIASAPILFFLISPLHGIGWLSDGIGALCYDGDGRNLNKDLPNDAKTAWRKGNWAKAVKLSAALASTILLLSSSAQTSEKPAFPIAALR